MKIAVIGLGYVGLPLFAKFRGKVEVVGYDKSEKRISELTRGYDRNREVSSKELDGAIVSSDPSIMENANVFIITVPTPVHFNKEPDLNPLRDATRVVGRYVMNGGFVVYESTVYPGCTEEICVPILETESGLRLNEGFGVGYSPERVNPGDTNHTVEKINKLVSTSMNAKYLNKIIEIYSNILSRHQIFPVDDIRTCEAAKAIENTQRDINIAFFNELSMIFDRLGIDTRKVVNAAETKWNFISFRPGLVGGHCIGVDPYYLAHAAKKYGIEPDFILSGRSVNERMVNFVVEKVRAELNSALAKLGKTKPSINIFGATFKENCPDLRNSKVQDIYNELSVDFQNIYINDSVADQDELESLYGDRIRSLDDMPDAHVNLVCVSHDYIKKFLARDLISRAKQTTIIDVKWIIDPSELNSNIKLVTV